MTKSRFDRTISPARRGQIVQRVIVDGWTTADIATSYGVPEHLVDLWVEDFRRNGMASLRQEPGRSIAAEIEQLTIWRPIRANLRKVAIALRCFVTVDPQAKPLPLCRSHKDGPR
jgi:transposase-like protein